jgi:hypothetical protein
MLRAVACLLVLLAGLGLALSSAQAAPPALQAPEFQVKAAFLFKFGGYVQWPAGAFESADSPLVIGVLGDGKLAGELARITRGRAIEGRPVHVRKLKQDEPLLGLHVLYLGDEDRAARSGAMAASRGLPTLIVTASPAGMAEGSVINFMVVDEKVRFDVALGPAEARGLKISSRLLAVARTVQGAPR